MSMLLWILGIIEVVGGIAFTVYSIREKVWVEKWWHWIFRFVFWWITWLFDEAMNHLF